MAKFLVDLKLQIGEYEKNATHLIDAETKPQAMLQAMADESHGNAIMDTDGVWWDMGGEMAYCVRRCSEIPDETASVLTNTQCFYVSRFNQEQICEMLNKDISNIETYLGYLS